MKNIEKVAEVIDVPRRFLYDGATNIVRLGKVLLSSAVKSKKFFDKLDYEVVYFDLGEFEKSGADLSCLFMHLN